MPLSMSVSRDLDRLIKLKYKKAFLGKLFSPPKEKNFLFRFRQKKGGKQNIEKSFSGVR